MSDDRRLTRRERRAAAADERRNAKRAAKATVKFLASLTEAEIDTLNERCKGKTAPEIAEELSLINLAATMRREFEDHIGKHPQYDREKFKADAGCSFEDLIASITPDTVLDCLHQMTEGAPGPNGKTYYIEDPAALARFRGYLDQHQRVLDGVTEEEAGPQAFLLDFAQHSRDADVILDNFNPNGSITIYANAKTARRVIDVEWMPLVENAPPEMVKELPHLTDWQCTWATAEEGSESVYDAVGKIARSIKQQTPDLHVVVLRRKPKGYVGAEEIAA